MYGFELDLIQQKLNEGHIVKILHCDGSTSFCSANNSKIMSYKKIKLVCSYCKSKFYNGLNWLDNKKNLIIESFDLLNTSQKKTVFEFEKLLEGKNKLDEEILSFLNNIYYQLGNICRTTLMTETSNAIINYEKKETYNFFKIIAKSSIEAYYSSLNNLEKFDPDEIIKYQLKYFHELTKRPQNLCLDNNKLKNLFKIQEVSVLKQIKSLLKELELSR